MPVDPFSIPHIFQYYIGESEIESSSMPSWLLHTEGDPADEEVHHFSWPQRLCTLFTSINLQAHP